MEHGIAKCIETTRLVRRRSIVGHIRFLGCSYRWHTRTDGRSFGILAYTSFALGGIPEQILQGIGLRIYTVLIRYYSRTG